jgi:hypothetical protein
MGTWTAVDHLIRKFETIRRDALQAGPEDKARASVDNAVANAAEAIDFAIDSPGNPDRLIVARDAVQDCTELLRALDRERVRTQQALGRGASLRLRALELVDMARAYASRPPALY